MVNLEHARCPECGKVANSKEQVKKIFGIRNNNGYMMVQSWCRECRSKS